MSEPTALDLWQKVLERAIADATRGPTEAELQDYIFCTKMDATMWLNSDATTPGSFRWVCDMHGLEPSSVRKLVKKTT